MTGENNLGTPFLRFSSFPFPFFFFALLFPGFQPKEWQKEKRREEKMEAYLDYNLKFLRALQDSDIVSANEFANKIDALFPNHPNVQNFRDVIASHLQSLQQKKLRKGSSTSASAHNSIARSSTSASGAAVSDDDEDEDEGEEDDEDDEGADGVESSDLKADDDDDDDDDDDGPLVLPEAARKPVPVTSSKKPAASASASSTKKVPAGAAGGSKPSIRDHVIMCREVNDEVDAMFADADKQIEEEMKKRAAMKK